VKSDARVVVIGGGVVGVERAVITSPRRAGRMCC